MLAIWLIDDGNLARLGPVNPVGSCWETVIVFWGSF